MSTGDWLILLALAAAVILAVRSMVRNRKNKDRCTGNCASCGRNCR